MSVARPIPVFRPTTEEFSDFSKYVTSIEPIAEQYGICKIIPPEGWRPRISSYDDLNIEIPCPIRQFVHGKQGVYQVVNVMEKPMSLAQFKQASEEQFAKCFPKSKREGSDAEKFDIEELERRFWKNLTFHAPLYGADMLGTLFEEEDDVAKGSEEEQEANDEKDSSGEIDIVEIDEPPAKGKKKVAQRSPKRKRGSTESAASTEAKGLDETTKDQKKRNAWNLGHLDTLLSQRLGKLLPGVTSPYLYFGMWKSLFACHTEDMDLYSINFLHFGKPKVWYGVPSAQKHRVDQVARLHFPMQFKECSEFLRHKSAMFSPSVLKMGNVSMTHAVQQPGEFIITFPGAYHFGFNAGFNCAEAVNFALQRWLDFGKKAKPCKCVADSVTIDVGMFINMVTNGEELLPDVLPAAKKSKTAPATKPKRVAKRRSREKATTTTTATAKATTAMVGGRSMGMVAGRMMAAPQASAALPEPPEFVEETLGEEDVPVFSDDELRSGDENDGGEYREGSKKQAKKQAKKPRRSKRMENKRNAAPSGTDEPTEAPASSKSEAQPVERKEPARRKKQARVAAVPAADATPNGSDQLPKATDATATTPKPQPKKRAVKRKSAKLADRFQKKAKGQEEPSQEPKTAVNTREYQGLKIIIRPPRADNSNGSPVPTSAPAPATTTAGSAPTGVRKQRATASKRSKPQKSAAIKKGKKANPDLMPEGKTAAWQQLNAEANRQHNRDGTDTDLTRVTGPESTGRQVPLQPALSTFYAPYMAGAAGRQQGPPSYGHFLIGGDRTQQERPQAQAAPEPRHAVQSFPTLKDFMSSQVAYPPISTFTSTFSSAPSLGSAPEPTVVQPGSAYSLALEMQRHKLKELREKQQQLQQLRQERQPQLQQLHQFIQAQRQLQHQPPTEPTASSSSTSLPYGAGGYPSGLPAPLPTLPVTTTTATSSLPSFTSTFAAAYGLPLPPSTLSSSPPPPSVPSSFPPPQHYAPPLPPSQHLRPAPAHPQAPPESAGGATPPKLVHILPSPAPVGALAALYAPRTAPTSYAPSSVPVPTPSTFPVSS